MCGSGGTKIASGLGGTKVTGAPYHGEILDGHLEERGEAGRSSRRPLGRRDAAMADPPPAKAPGPDLETHGLSGPRRLRLPDEAAQADAQLLPVGSVEHRVGVRTLAGRVEDRPDLRRALLRGR